jgi:hypothetical protein
MSQFHMLARKQFKECCDARFPLVIVTSFPARTM